MNDDNKNNIKYSDYTIRTNNEQIKSVNQCNIVGPIIFIGASIFLMLIVFTQLLAKEINWFMFFVKSPFLILGIYFFYTNIQDFVLEVKCQFLKMHETVHIENEKTINVQDLSSNNSNTVATNEDKSNEEVAVKSYTNITNTIQKKRINDKNTFLSMLTENPRAIKDIGESLVNDPDIFLTIITNSKNFRLGYTGKLSESEEFVKLVAENMGDNLKNNIDFAKKVIAENFRYFKFFGNNIMSNEEICLMTGEFEFIDEKLKDNQEFMIKVFKKIEGKAVLYASDRLRNNKDFMYYMIKNDDRESRGYVYRFIGDTLKNDKELLMLAINNGFHIFRIIAEKFKNDKEVILEFIKQEDFNFSWIGNNAPEIWIMSSFNISDLSGNLRDDYDIAKVAVLKDSTQFSSLSVRLKDNEELALIAVKSRGDILAYVSDRLKNNKQIVIESVKNDGSAIHYASKSLQKNIDVINSSAKITFDEAY